jgi:deoxyadenosine/deoxycytidine kinase
LQASCESVEIIAERIQQRARSIVDTIYPDYLRLFDSYFQRWALELAESPILTVDSQLYDFVNNPAHLKEIIDRT